MHNALKLRYDDYTAHTRVRRATGALLGWAGVFLSICSGLSGCGGAPRQWEWKPYERVLLSPTQRLDGIPRRSLDRYACADGTTPLAHSFDGWYYTIRCL